jgi:hypothetical protein
MAKREDIKVGTQWGYYNDRSYHNETKLQRAIDNAVVVLTEYGTREVRYKAGRLYGNTVTTRDKKGWAVRFVNPLTEDNEHHRKWQIKPVSLTVTGFEDAFLLESGNGWLPVETLEEMKLECRRQEAEQKERKRAQTRRRKALLAKIKEHQAILQQLDIALPDADLSGIDDDDIENAWGDVRVRLAITDPAMLDAFVSIIKYGLPSPDA